MELVSPVVNEIIELSTRYWELQPAEKPVAAEATRRQDEISPLAGRLGWFDLPDILLESAARLYSGYPFMGIGHRLKFFLRALTTPRLTLDWFALWQSPQLVPLLESHPRVLTKLQRPYLYNGLRAKGRCEILRQHYVFILEFFPPEAIRRIFTHEGVKLVEIPEMEVGRFSVRLFYGNQFEKEGELSLVIYDDDREGLVFALSFCVTSDQSGRRIIFIGGLQGCQLSKNGERVVAMTRGMHGLRPKALLLYTLQQLAVLWNIRCLRAVSNDARKIRLNRRNIQADYDKFWLDSGGSPESDGTFSLPAVFTPRDIGAIKPKKRTMYRRRYEMLAGLNEQIMTQLSRLGCLGPIK